MATATKTAKSLKVVCPLCLDSEADVTVNLNDLSKITCGSCCEEFSAKEAVARMTKELAKWQAVAAWIDAAPVE